MYLVHVHINSAGSGPVCEDLAAHVLAACHATPAEIEHAVVHGAAAPPVVGVYLRSGSLAQAETLAHLRVNEALEGNACMRGWRVERAEVPLIAPCVELELRPQAP